MSETKKNKTIIGTVVSDKMDKTATVKIEYKKLHPLYKKYVKKSKKFKIHDENNDCNIGDIVKFVITKPLSKTKFCNLVEIVTKAK